MMFEKTTELPVYVVNVHERFPGDPSEWVVNVISEPGNVLLLATGAASYAEGAEVAFAFLMSFVNGSGGRAS
jgi:hypothetical protein